jgi:thiamine-phosphate pyrophosphorylase
MNETLRIIDANLNRAREALRVIEDYARFALDDADAAGATKVTRHELRQISAEAARVAGPHALLTSRDIESDVGRELKTAAETQRTTSEDVVRAEFARFSECVRSIAEFGKLVSPAITPVAEALRYRGYALEQRISLRGGLRARFRKLRLYVIITEALCRRPWLDTAEAAIRGGAACIQLREKQLTDADLLRRARTLRELTARHGALFIVNDRPDIARLAGADGVHLGQDDLPVKDARHIAGGHMLVGKSTHTLAQLDAALAEEPDYVAVGPMFASATKPQPTIAGIELLAAAASRTALPLVAIGGITAAVAPAVRAAGSCCICVCSAVASADDPQVAAEAILRSGT